ncbi:hypothetical protein AARAC_011566 [Aspergillus arachidicola]|uniref:Uncharacterized protein n=1 Tax=Aspergillus arachidicola TaxID=656916 RepID=A0A2G7FPX4_9EURO|nr:hypothetical protein AARAC_011566 [Aspergillus arachidicola]
MPVSSPLKAAAKTAAAKVRSKVSRSSHEKYAWLYAPPATKDDINPVVECWLKDQGNLDYVSGVTGGTFRDNPLENVVESFAIVWTKNSGTIERPFPGKYLLIVGLEYVDQNNGLPILEETTSLDHGEYVLVSGDKDLKLNDKGGGISLFIILDLV